MFVKIVSLLSLLLGLSRGQEVTGCIGNVSQECSRKYSCYAVIVSKLAPDVMCDGVLVHKEWVLTTTLCALLLFKNNTQGNGKVEIWMGFDGEKAVDIQYRKAVKYVTHKKIIERNLKTWKMNRYDLVLLQLEKPFTKTNYVDTAKLPKKGEFKTCESAEAMTLYFELRGKGSGKGFIELAALFYGLLYWSWRPRANVPDVGSIALGTKRGTTCCGQKQWGEKGEKTNIDKSICEITDMIICQSKKKSCLAKSGTPLFCDGTLIGMENNCQEGGVRSSEPSAYIKVENYLDFIAQEISGKKSATTTEKDKKLATTTEKDKKLAEKSSTGTHVRVLMKILVVITGHILLNFMKFSYW